MEVSLISCLNTNLHIHGIKLHKPTQEMAPGELQAVHIPQIT